MLPEGSWGSQDWAFLSTLIQLCPLLFVWWFTSRGLVPHICDWTSARMGRVVRVATQPL